ncbi:hypothetical protein BGZ98_009791 [Dissophora globulifera]|nr:hypothetical protein BGZ98_009791 [Dissophora globulifera]
MSLHLNEVARDELRSHMIKEIASQLAAAVLVEAHLQDCERSHHEREQALRAATQPVQNQSILGPVFVPGYGVLNNNLPFDTVSPPVTHCYAPAAMEHTLNPDSFFTDMSPEVEALTSREGSLIGEEESTCLEAKSLSRSSEETDRDAVFDQLDDFCSEDDVRRLDGFAALRAQFAAQQLRDALFRLQQAQSFAGYSGVDPEDRPASPPLMPEDIRNLVMETFAGTTYFSAFSSISSLQLPSPIPDSHIESRSSLSSIQDLPVRQPTWRHPETESPPTGFQYSTRQSRHQEQSLYQRYSNSQRVLTTDSLLSPMSVNFANAGRYSFASSDASPESEKLSVYGHYFDEDAQQLYHERYAEVVTEYGDHPTEFHLADDVFDYHFSEYDGDDSTNNADNESHGSDTYEDSSDEERYWRGLKNSEQGVGESEIEDIGDEEEQDDNDLGNSRGDTGATQVSADQATSDDDNLGRTHSWQASDHGTSNVFSQFPDFVHYRPHAIWTEIAPPIDDVTGKSYCLGTSYFPSCRHSRNDELILTRPFLPSAIVVTPPTVPSDDEIEAGLEAISASTFKAGFRKDRTILCATDVLGRPSSSNHDNSRHSDPQESDNDLSHSDSLASPSQNRILSPLTRSHVTTQAALEHAQDPIEMWHSNMENMESDSEIDAGEPESQGSPAAFMFDAVGDLMEGDYDVEAAFRSVTLYQTEPTPVQIRMYEGNQRWIAEQLRQTEAAREEKADVENTTADMQK